MVATQGSYRVNGTAAKARDGVEVSGAEAIRIEADDDTELLLFDLP